MEITQAKNSEEDFQGFLSLEKEFSELYTNLGVDRQYQRMSFDEEPASNHRKEFEEYLNTPKSFFAFAKENSLYLGYIYGYLDDANQVYKIRQVGILDTIIVTKNSQDKGVATKMRDDFFSWLKNQNISICLLHAKVENQKALEIYKSWGFEIDELRLWKKI